MVWNPEIPLAPVTIAVRSLILGEKVGRFLKMPESFKGRCWTPMMVTGVNQPMVEEQGLHKTVLYDKEGHADGLKA
jgi:hypothetical protein